MHKTHPQLNSLNRVCAMFVCNVWSGWNYIISCELQIYRDINIYSILITTFPCLEGMLLWNSICFPRNLYVIKHAHILLYSITISLKSRPIIWNTMMQCPTELRIVGSMWLWYIQILYDNYKLNTVNICWC